MNLMTKLKTFGATMIMGAVAHVVTTQTGVIQQKLGLTNVDPQKMGIELAEKAMKGDYNKFLNGSVAKVMKTAKTATKQVTEIPEAEASVKMPEITTKAKRTPASVPQISKLDEKLCSFKSSYVAKDQANIKKNYRSLQDMYFKNKKLTEKEAGVFVGKLEGYLASGKYDDKKIICPK